MKMNERFSEYVRACFSGIWLQSHEHQDALMEVGRICQEQSWRFAVWNIESGLTFPVERVSNGPVAGDPLSAVRAAATLINPEGASILVLQNFHRFLQSAEIVQAMIRQMHDGKQNRVILVVLSPVVQLPVEFEKLFVVLEHDLPDRQELEQIARGIATEDNTFEAAKEFCARLGKTVTVAEDFPAFIVNRILLPMINEAIYTLYEGVGSVEAIDTAMRLGANHPMGPLQLADFIGLDTCLSVMQVLHEGLADTKYRPCPLLVKYVEAGWLGKKTQRGFYDDRSGSPVPTR